MNEDVEIIYPDLPRWAQPGASAVIQKDDYTRVTITKVTRTQIVAVNDQYANAEYRCTRELIFPRGMYGPYAEGGFAERGAHFSYLISPDEPQAVKGFMRQHRAQAITTLSGKIQAALSDRLSTDEAQLGALEAIEAAVAKARKAFEA